MSDLSILSNGTTAYNIKDKTARQMVTVRDAYQVRSNTEIGTVITNILNGVTPYSALQPVELITTAAITTGNSITLPAYTKISLSFPGTGTFYGIAITPEPKLYACQASWSGTLTCTEVNSSGSSVGSNVFFATTNTAAATASKSLTFSNLDDTTISQGDLIVIYPSISNTATSPTFTYTNASGSTVTGTFVYEAGYQLWKTDTQLICVAMSETVFAILSSMSYAQSLTVTVNTAYLDDANYSVMRQGSLVTVSLLYIPSTTIPTNTALLSGLPHSNSGVHTVGGNTSGTALLFTLSGSSLVYNTYNSSSAAAVPLEVHFSYFTSD